MRSRTQQLHEDAVAAMQSYEQEKTLSDRYSQTLLSSNNALQRLKEVINSSRFVTLSKSTDHLNILDVLPYYHQMTYQMLSLNSKFTTLSEVECSQRLRLKSLFSELETLKTSSSKASQLTESINRMWTNLGHEPMVLESHFEHALFELNEETKSEENLKKSEDFLCVLYLMGTEVAKQIVSLLVQIEKWTHQLPSSITLPMSVLTSIIKPQTQKVTLLPPTPEFKKYHASLARKSSFQTPLRVPLSLTPGVHMHRSVTTEDSELTENPPLEVVSFGLSPEMLKEILIEEQRFDENTKEAVLNAFNEIQTVKVFIDKIRLREILQVGRGDGSGLVELMLKMVRESHGVCMEKFQRRTEAIRNCLVAVMAATQVTSKQVNEQTPLPTVPSSKSSNELNEAPKVAAPLFESKGKTTPFPSFRRHSRLLSDTRHDGIFSGTEVDEEDDFQEAEREFFKTRGASLVPGLQRRSVRSQSTTNFKRKTNLMLQRKGSDFEKGLLEQNQVIAQRIKALIDSGTPHTDRDRQPKTAKHTLPRLFKKSGSVTTRAPGKLYPN